MKYVFLFMLSFSLFFSEAFTLTNTDSPHLPAEIWQRADGKYCVKVLTAEDADDPNNHVFLLDCLIHSEDCPCDLNISIYTFK